MGSHDSRATTPSDAVRGGAARVTGRAHASLLTVARRLVQRGFSVIPLDHPKRPATTNPERAGKVPTARWEPFQRRRPTDDELMAWFDDGTLHNIAIVTGPQSGIVVVDLDSSGALAWAIAHLPFTPMRVITGKGEHWYYRHPGHIAIRNRARVETADGVLAIDIRGDGGYVVAPGSMHHTGHIYRAPERWPESLDAVPVFELAWFTAVRSSDPVSGSEFVHLQGGFGRRV